MGLQLGYCPPLNSRSQDRRRSSWFLKDLPFWKNLPNRPCTFGPALPNKERCFRERFAALLCSFQNLAYAKERRHGGYHAGTGPVPTKTGDKLNFRHNELPERLRGTGTSAATWFVRQDAERCKQPNQCDRLLILPNQTASGATVPEGPAKRRAASLQLRSGELFASQAPKTKTETDTRFRAGCYGRSAAVALKAQTTTEDITERLFVNEPSLITGQAESQFLLPPSRTRKNGRRLGDGDQL
jgi:hypothetical protein